MSESPRLTGRWQVDECSDAQGCWTIRPANGTPNGDTSAQPIATVYLEKDARRIAEATEDRARPFTITIEVSEETIANLLCSAWEGGSCYWMSGGRPYTWERVNGRMGPLKLALPVTVYERNDGKNDGDNDGDTPYTLDDAAIRRGLSLLPKWPHHLRDVVSSDGGDASTGDVFLQLCILGDIVYG